MSTRIYQCEHAQLAPLVGAVDVVLTDPPFSPRVHGGQAVKRHDGALGLAAEGFGYDAWTAAHVHEFIATWAPRTRRWMLLLCSHDLIPVYERALADAGRVVFAPVPCVIRGMSVRLTGDGPSSWAVYLLAARPRGMRPLSGTLPGAYSGPRERLHMRGGKPVWLLDRVIQDYVRQDDVICDPCAGSGTTAVAAMARGVAVVGGEPDPARYAIMRSRLDAARHTDRRGSGSDPGAIAQPSAPRRDRAKHRSAAR